MTGRIWLTAVCLFVSATVAGPALGQLTNSDITAKLVSCRSNSPYTWTGVYLAQGNFYPSPDPSAYACFTSKSECRFWLRQVRERPHGIVFISRCDPRDRR